MLQLPKFHPKIGLIQMWSKLNVFLNKSNFAVSFIRSCPAFPIKYLFLREADGYAEQQQMFPDDINKI